MWNRYYWWASPPLGVTELQRQGTAKDSMRQASPGVRTLARRLVLAAPGDATTAATSADAWNQHYEPLRLQLTQVVGGEGFRALLTRALALAKGEHPWLGEVQVEPPGSLTGLSAALAGRDPEEGEAGCITVLMHVLGLLVILVGVEITGQLVSRAWPDIPVQGADLDPEEGEG